VASDVVLEVFGLEKLSLEEVVSKRSDDCKGM
jgi:hypothetical protein